MWRFGTSNPILTTASSTTPSKGQTSSFPARPPAASVVSYLENNVNILPRAVMFFSDIIEPIDLTPLMNESQDVNSKASKNNDCVIDSLSFSKLLISTANVCYRCIATFFLSFILSFFLVIIFIQISAMTHTLKLPF